MVSSCRQMSLLDADISTNVMPACPSLNVRRVLVSKAVRVAIEKEVVELRKHQEVTVTCFKCILQCMSMNISQEF